MFDEPPVPPVHDASGSKVTLLETVPMPPRHVCASYALDPARPGEVICTPFEVIEVPAEEGRVVIDLTQFVPPRSAEACTDAPADPLNSDIVVCAESGPAPRLGARVGPLVGPVDDGFGSAIPRARIKLSDHAEAQANLQNNPVGGFNANGGEVRLKIDF
jgi:hypothetical protein